MKLWGLEPTRIVGLVVAGITLAVAFGINITSEQARAIEAFVNAILIVVGAEVIRSQVIPSAKVDAALGPVAVEKAGDVTKAMLP